MSVASETLEIVKLLRHTKPLTEKEAARIVDYVEKRKDKSIDRLWVVMIGGFAFISVFFRRGLGMAIRRNEP